MLSELMRVDKSQGFPGIALSASRRFEHFNRTGVIVVHRKISEEKPLTGRQAGHIAERGAVSMRTW